MTVKFTRKRVNVYCVGGTGINIGYKAMQRMSTAIDGLADFNFVFVDTSDSNIRSDIPDSHFYRIGADGGVNGSGKIRSENAGVIMDHAESILSKFSPEEENIVLGGLGGGSGSVIGPVLTKWLLEADKVVFTIGVGSADTRKEQENTIKTIQTYEKIAKDTKRPVPMFYQFNENQERQASDDAVLWALNYLSIVIGALGIEASGLDSMDLFNFVNFHRASGAEPQLARICVWSGNTNPDLDLIKDDVIAVLTVSGPEARPVLGLDPEYRATADVPAEGLGQGYPYDLVNKNGPLGVYVINGGFNSVFQELNQQFKEGDARRRTRTTKPQLLGKDDGGSATGSLIL